LHSKLCELAQNASEYMKEYVPLEPKFFAT